ncbi:MAG TPA: 4Fe-4S binding protein [Fastidiosipila sp.]|nr:4Fe-4S binding protein [Fastidiosipila sp.]
MAHVISAECISCGSCEPECPTSAISAGDTQYIIDAEACIDCGACAAVCPVDCITQE